MTIKELEQRTGMARANIRYYEGEGLLFPKRLDNGYRDYSEEDAKTLEKIKLLRQLQLDIDTIRKVQQGALTLDQALFVQQTKLEGDRLLIERAAEVCRDLGESGVEYAALDPQPYLMRLELPQPGGPALPAPPEEEKEEREAWEPQACYCPWQRLFARFLDMTLYDTVFNVLWLVLLHDQSLIQLQAALSWGMGLVGLLGQWLSSLALLAFTLAVEPLWLHFVGWTPGKWVFGLKLRNKDGEKLPLDWAFERSWTLAWEGYGWSIPIYGLWRLWKGRKEALEGWSGSWNGEHACRYTKQARRFSGWVFAGVSVLCAAALFFGIQYAVLPPCRGELTTAELARNYNHFRAQVTWGDGLPRMEADGRWGERADGYWQSGTVQTKVDGVWVELEEPVWDQPEFTLEDGQVTAVTLRVSGGCIDGLPSVQRELLMMLALSGSTDNWSLLNPDLDGWLTAADEALDQFGDGETRQRGLWVTKREELSGYQETEEFWFLTPVVGEKQHYERVVTISLNE